MKTTARTTVPAQRTSAHQRAATTPPPGGRQPQEHRRLILAVASVIAALAAAAALITLVLIGGIGTTSAPEQVVAPGAPANGSDQHLLNQAREHAASTNQHNAGLRDFQ